MKEKFKSAELPYNDISDFKTTDISVDIICRVWLSEAPGIKQEKYAKGQDGKNYNPNRFYIECVAGKNEPNGDVLNSDWLLYYMTESKKNLEFGFVSEMEEGYDVENAWDFFNKEMFGVTELDNKISRASERIIKGSEHSIRKHKNIEI